MNKWSLSLKAFLSHTALVVIALLLMVSPLGHKPGAIHPVLILPFFYLLLSGLPYFACFIYGVYEVWKGIDGVGSRATIGSSLLIMSAMAYGIIRMWPLSRPDVKNQHEFKH